MPRYLIQIRTAGLSAVIGINRSHIVVDREGTGATLVREVNEWIMPRGNRLSVLLAAREHGAPEAPDPAVAVQVFIARPGDRHHAVQTTLAEFGWPLPAAQAAPLPHLADIPFAVQDAPPARLWGEADKLTGLATSDMDEIVALVERLRRAIEQRRLDEAYALVEYRYRDLARANGEDYATLAAGVRGLYQDLFNEPRLHVEPLSRAGAGFSLVADNQVVLVSRGPARDALRAEAGTAPQRRFYGFPIYVARIQGRWTIVR